MVDAKVRQAGRRGQGTVLKVVVYSLPSEKCPQCRFTKRKFQDFGIEFDEVYVDRDAEALERVRREVLSDPNARLSLPVVRVELGDGATWTWQGYRPSQIEQLAGSLAGV